MTKNSSRIFSAFDLEDQDLWKPWLARLAGRVAAVKVGLQVFTLGGPGLVTSIIHDHRLPVFLDLKFHDIPNTVYLATRAAAKMGVGFLTVHASGGEAMLKAAVRAAGENADGVRPKILAVTVLTSQGATPEEVLRRAELAQACGCDGVIASPLEIEILRAQLGSEFLIVTPGIRLPGQTLASADDQRRTASPEDALNWGADYLVMGRSLFQHPDPEGLLKSLNQLSGRTTHAAKA